MDDVVTLAQLEAYCQEFGLMTQVRAEQQLLLVLVPVPGQPRLGYLELDAERRIVTLRLPSLLDVAEARQGEAARLIAHINYLIVLGRLSMDIRDGEVMWEVPLPYSSAGLDQEMLLRAFAATAQILGEYLPTLARVTQSDCSAADILGSQPSVPSLQQVLDQLRGATDNDQGESAQG